MSKEKAITVRAKSLGYYNHKRRKEGAVFLISGETYKEGTQKGQVKADDPRLGKVIAFSDKWMELVNKDTPSAPAPTAEEDARETRALSSPTPAPEKTGRAEEDLGTPSEEALEEVPEEVDSKSNEAFSLKNSRQELEDKAKSLGTDDEVLKQCTNKAQVLDILKGCGVEVKE